MPGGKKTFDAASWQAKLAQARIPKEDMNSLVMDFLVTEGYVDAARTFQRESGTAPSANLDEITDRMQIRQAVQTGNVEQAVERVNDMNPEVLETSPSLFFHLQQQRLIELIREGQAEAALDFAQEYLAPLAEDQAAFLEEMERTVALLAFEDGKTSPVGDLLDVAQRQKTAGELNAAILASQGKDKEARLPALLRLLLWSQAQLEEKATFPRITDLASAQLDNGEGAAKPETA